jgi:hypothetical protein
VSSRLSANSPSSAVAMCPTRRLPTTCSAWASS